MRTKIVIILVILSCNLFGTAYADKAVSKKSSFNTEMAVWINIFVLKDIVAAGIKSGSMAIYCNKEELGYVGITNDDDDNVYIFGSAVNALKLTSYTFASKANFSNYILFLSSYPKVLITLSCGYLFMTIPEGLNDIAGEVSMEGQYQLKGAIMFEIVNGRLIITGSRRIDYN